MRYFLICILSLAAIACAQAPTTQATTQTMEGYVFNSVTSQPVVGARVALQIGPNSQTTTDSGGYFRLALSSAPVGNVTISRTGFLRRYQQFGGRATPSTTPLRVDLTPESVISGRLIDEDGFPMYGAMVQPMRYTTVDGQRRLQIANSGPWTQTNDLGEFRIAGLTAGRYFLRFAPMGAGQAWDARYSAQFFPGTPEPRDESAVEVKAGEEHGQVEFHVLKQEGVVVAGHVAMPSGGPVSMGVFVELRTGAPNTQTVAINSAKRDGTFYMPHVPPGTYTLYARNGNSGPAPKAGDLWAQQQLQVQASDQRDVALQLRTVEPVDLPGTVVFENGAGPFPVVITMRANTGAGPWTKSGEDGTFLLKGMLPGHYHVMANPDFQRAAGATITPRPSGRLTSVRWGDLDVRRDGFDFDGASTGPLRITFAGATATLTGTLLDPSGQPAAARMLMLMGEAPEAGGGGQTRDDGSFTISLWTPGVHHVYVISDYSAVQDPDYLKAHEADFPPLRIVAGRNGPITLKMPAQP